MFQVYIWPESRILFPALDNIHFLRVFGKNSGYNAPPMILSSSPLGISSNITNATRFSTPPTPPTLSHQPLYPCCHTTNGLSPIIMNEAFNVQENERYNLRSGIHLASRHNSYQTHAHYIQFRTQAVEINIRSNKTCVRFC